MTERKLSSSNFSNQAFLEERCSLNELLNLLSKRWMTETILGIEEGINRFTSLKEELKFISDHILANRLRLLEDYKLIAKESFNEIPPRVEYTLTKSGKELCSLLDRFCNFSDSCMSSHPALKKS
jgi:DNA-binding HxlR family transcriptional regulator